MPAKSDIYHIDTSNVLFILSGAFVGLDNVVRGRVAKGVRPWFIHFPVYLLLTVCWVMDSQ